MDVGQRVGHELFRASRPLFEERYGDRLSEGDRAVLDWLETRGPELLHALHAEAPRALVHGDFRLDNLLFDEEPAPLIKEADPEFERLLDEEDAIEASTREQSETPNFRAND